MHDMRYRKKTLFVIGLIFVITGFILWQNSSSSPARGVAGQKQKMLKQINEKGPREAYKLLKEEYSQKPGLAHTATHLFGQLLYEKVGMKAILICDNSFGYACYHGVYIAAILQKGESILQELDSICNTGEANNDLNCPHGIGHGILESKGHTKLLDSLNTCEKLSNEKNRFGCENGVFMEYNFPALDDKNGIKNSSQREYDSQNPLSPCNSVPSKYNKVCYFSLSQYLRAVFHYDYSQMGRVCSGVSDIKSRRWCFEGIGNNLPYDNNNQAKMIINSCNKMPTKEGRSYCLLGARWASAQVQLEKDLCKEYQRMTSLNCDYNYGQFLEEK